MITASGTSDSAKPSAAIHSSRPRVHDRPMPGHRSLLPAPAEVAALAYQPYDHRAPTSTDPARNRKGASQSPRPTSLPITGEPAPPPRLKPRANTPDARRHPTRAN